MSTSEEPKKYLNSTTAEIKAIVKWWFCGNTIATYLDGLEGIRLLKIIIPLLMRH